jgi:hypothetical protein
VETVTVTQQHGIGRLESRRTIGGLLTLPVTWIGRDEEFGIGNRRVCIWKTENIWYVICVARQHIRGRQAGLFSYFLNLKRFLVYSRATCANADISLWEWLSTCEVLHLDSALLASIWANDKHPLLQVIPQGLELPSATRLLKQKPSDT